MPFNDDQVQVLQISIIVSCTLSMIGSSLIILSYVLWKDVQSPLRKLLLFLSISDFVTACGNVFGSLFSEHPLFCIAQSFITTYSSMVSFMWTMAIAIYLYMIICRLHSLALKFIFLFHLVCWGVPLMLVCVAMGFNALGFDDVIANHTGWCWVAANNMIPWPPVNPQLFWKLADGKILEMCTYILTPIIYILSKRKLDFEQYDQRLILNTNVRNTLQNTDRKLVLIPIIFVGVRIWGSLRFLLQGFYPGLESVFWLALFQCVGDSAQGWANCLLYCVFTRKIRNKFIWRCCPLVVVKLCCTRILEDVDVAPNEKRIATFEIQRGYQEN